MFHPVNQKPDLPSLEAAHLARWKQDNIFQATLDKTADGEPFNLFEGPPTANGKPGVHHVESRAFKDIFPRYQTMKGRYVRRIGGWDCHGIPVELQIEKELGLESKKDIEAYGVEEFNKKCRASVVSFVDDWAQLTERVAYWADLENSYWTMNTSYVESIWWSLQKIYNDGNLYEGHRVVPYCGRCGTALSDHEVAQGYAETEDPSVYVRFPVISGKLAKEGAALAIWTTTPWTLTANMLVSAGPTIEYVLVRPVQPPVKTDKDGNEVAQPPVDTTPLVLAKDLIGNVIGEHYEIIRNVPIDELVGTKYSGPYEFYKPANDHYRFVSLADYVTTSDGTGLVHSAPAFGAEDYDACKREGVDLFNPVNKAGEFISDLPEMFAGKFVKNCDSDIIRDLKERGLLIKRLQYKHTYPFCWRCKNPLIYYATPSWYISTTKNRDKLLAFNQTVEWHPPHIKDGRYGEWLRNNIDWALSRTRYWGTPLPIWRSEDHEEVVIVGSLAELGELAGKDLSELDPHRPYIDEITIPSKQGKGVLRRVPDVIDAWYDSGAMPFAQFGYPWVEGSKELFEKFAPADYVCEAIDQTRGWFYSMMAESAMLFDNNNYKAVLCLGHIVDGQGKKMSKSQGNIIDPWEILNQHGADALRWLMFCDGSPWVNRRVSHETVEDVVRRFILTLWNSYYFLVTYARIDKWVPDNAAYIPVEERPIMDRWIISELAKLVTTTDEALAQFDSTTAGRAIEDFVDGLSNWYIRRSRNRFWACGDSADKESAFQTLHEALRTVAILLAPFTPFLAEELHENLVRNVNADAPKSVHLEDFPQAQSDVIDEELNSAMAVARQVVKLGLRARNDVQIGVRQPLPEVLLTSTSTLGHWDDIINVVKDELNVKAITFSSADASDTVSYELKANFRTIGAVHGKETPKIAQAITSLVASEVVGDLHAGKPIMVPVGDATVEVTADMVQIIEHSREGWQVATEGPMSVALRTEIDDELRKEGIAREFVRAINDQRKALNFNLENRISATVTAAGELAASILAHESYITTECLITTLQVKDETPQEATTTINELPVHLDLEVVQ